MSVKRSISKILPLFVKVRNVSCLTALLLVLGGATCQPVKEDPSQPALASGQATVLLGSDCQNPLEMGFTHCAITKGAAIPSLHLYFMNPAQYKISDCNLGNFVEGAVAIKAGEVVVDLSPLRSQIESSFCILKIEAIEFYPDPRDEKQTRQYPLAGGFFLESYEPGYFPTPPPAAVSWCYKISGTNQGRRKMEPCAP